MPTLNNLINENPVIKKKIIGLCNNLLETAKENKKAPEIIKSYTVILEKFNNNFTNPWGSDGFKYPPNTVSTFLSLCEQIWTESQEIFKKHYDRISLNLMKEDLSLFIFIALIDEYKFIRAAIEDALDLMNDEFSLLLRTLHMIVKEKCKFQSSFTFDEFQACASKLYMIYRLRHTDFSDDLF